MTSEEVGWMRFHFLEIRNYLTTRYKRYGNYNSTVYIGRQFIIPIMYEWQ